MTDRERKLMFLAATASSIGVVLAALAGHAELIAYVAPMCALALPLIAGRYLGEDALERLRTLREPRRGRRLAPSLPGGTRRAPAGFPRGGRLIAHSLAERAPPAAAFL